MAICRRHDAPFGESTGRVRNVQPAGCIPRSRVLLGIGSSAAARRGSTTRSGACHASALVAAGRCCAVTVIVSSRWTGAGTFKEHAFTDDQRYGLTVTRRADRLVVLAEHCNRVRAIDDRHANDDRASGDDLRESPAFLGASPSPVVERDFPHRSPAAAGERNPCVRLLAMAAGAVFVGWLEGFDPALSPSSRSLNRHCRASGAIKLQSCATDRPSGGSFSGFLHGDWNA